MDNIAAEVAGMTRESFHNVPFKLTVTTATTALNLT